MYCKKNLITREEKASMAALNTIIVYALNLEKSQYNETILPMQYFVALRANPEGQVQ